jgi:hypothetical protein
MQRVRFPRVTRRAAIFAGAGVAVASPFGYRIWEEARAERVIQIEGIQDPTQAGFAINMDISGVLVLNDARTQWEALHATTSQTGYYTRARSTAQKRLALRNGWRLTLVARVLAGSAYANVVFTPLGRRFDINPYVDQNGKTQVMLTEQVVPRIVGPTAAAGDSRTDYHRYELRYDPHESRATLFIDGAKRISGYSGFSQFAEEGRLFFGVGVWPGAKQGVADFKLVRFEINF